MNEAKSIINELLVEIFNRILTIEGEALKNKGVKLSMTEVHVLEAIDNIAEPSMTNISAKLGITAGSLSVSVNTLFQKGYVRRYTDADDRRKVLIALEPKAEEVLNVHAAFHKEMIDAVFTALRLEEDEVLIQSLKKVKDFFRDYPVSE